MEWLKEKMIGIIVAILVFSVLSGVNRGEIAVHPIAGPVSVLSGFASNVGGVLTFVVALAAATAGAMGWLVVPAALVAYGIWCGRRQGWLSFSTGRDDHGLPVIWWEEPRYDARRWIFKATSVEGCCWLGMANGEWLFCYQLDVPWFSREQACRIEVPLWKVTGFSVSSAGALYRTADQGELSDGHHQVVRVDLDPIHNGSAFIPLTFTSASAAEVESFHRALTTCFGAAALAAAFDKLSTPEEVPQATGGASRHSEVPERLA